jgi:hypothetical protein
MCKNKSCISGWVTIIFFVVGCCVFFPVYFSVVVPVKDKLNKTLDETCIISSVQENRYNCSQKVNCQCVGCGLVPSCPILQQQEISGLCCDGTCCSYTIEQPYSCRKYTCLGCSGSKKCCYGWRTCYRTICALYSTSLCILQWGDCWNPTVFFYIEGQKSIIRNKHFSCDFNDLECLNEILKEFPVAKSKLCWYDPKDNTVSFSKPDKTNYVGGWVGEAFGLLFLGISLISGMCYLCYFRRNNTKTKKENCILVLFRFYFKF